MNSIEEIIQAEPDAGQAFWEACSKVFSGDAGRLVLSVLCRLAHPLAHPPISDPVLSAHVRGRSEVVAALWRRSQSTIEPRDVPE